MTAADELAQGSLETAERYLELARRLSDSVPEARRGQLELLFGVVSLLLAGQRGNLPGVAEAAQRLGAMPEGADAAQPGLTEDLRALALISFGSTEFWAAGQNAGRHLESGLTLARRIGRPYLEFTGLVYQSLPEFYESFARSVERAMAAIELGRQHGWNDEPAFGVACLVPASALFWQGQLDESESWIRRAERTVRAETHPAPVYSIRAMRGLLELARGKYIDALAALEAAERLAQRLVTGQYFSLATRALVVLARVGLGEIERARELLAGFSRQDREQVEVGIAIAAVWLAEDDQHAAHAALAPILDSPGLRWFRIMAHVLDAMILDKLGDQAGAERALERALDVAEPDGVVTPFLMYPAPGLLERHARHSTAHASLLAQIQNLLSGTQPSPPARPRPLLEAPSDSELRVLRYLPTNLTGPEIAGELSVSANTVKTHLRTLYTKLGTHHRSETVARARDLGLLAPSARSAAKPKLRPARLVTLDQTWCFRRASRHLDDLHRRRPLPALCGAAPRKASWEPTNGGSRRALPAST